MSLFCSTRTEGAAESEQAHAERVSESARMWIACLIIVVLWLQAEAVAVCVEDGDLNDFPAVDELRVLHCCRPDKTESIKALDGKWAKSNVLILICSVWAGNNRSIRVQLHEEDGVVLGPEESETVGDFHEPWVGLVFGAGGEDLGFAQRLGIVVETLEVNLEDIHNSICKCNCET